MTKEKPILFSAPMIRALLAGTKTQTRRIAKIPSEMRSEDGDNDLTHMQWVPDHESGPGWYVWMTEYPEEGSMSMPCPYQVGDILWVRETWAVGHGYDGVPPRLIPSSQSVRLHYAATEERGGLLWRPSIFMPRWASRISLEITDVRIERLQNISNADAIVEGLFVPECEYAQNGPRAPRLAFKSLWESINSPGSWAENPWVWVVSFKLSATKPI